MLPNDVPYGTPPLTCDHELFAINVCERSPVILPVPETEAVIHWSFGIFRLSAICVDTIGRPASFRFRIVILSLPVYISQVTNDSLKPGFASSSGCTNQCRMIAITPDTFQIRAVASPSKIVGPFGPCGGIIDTPASSSNFAPFVYRPDL